MVRRVATALAVVIVAVGGASAGAQEPEPEPAVEITEPGADQPAGGIIVRPNSGTAPDDPGDRGGAWQLLLLGLIVAFFAIAILSIRRQMLRSRTSSSD